MKNKKILQKFFFKKGAIIPLILLTIVLGVIYSYATLRTSELSFQVSNLDNNSETVTELTKKHNNMQTYSEIILVFFSVAGSALLSSILIEKRNSNKIVEQIFVDDFLTSDNFLKILDDEEKLKVLTALETQLEFNKCREKSEMYVAVKNKLNKPLFGHDLFYEKYYLNIICDINEQFIEKTIVKCVEIKSLCKSINIDNYILLALTTPKSSDYIPAEIKKLTINGEAVDSKRIKQNNSESPDPLDKKRGYIDNIKFLLDKSLNFSSKKSIKIEMEYITRCPLNDMVYSCRMPYPCKNFDFNFVVRNDNYAINPVAFGFIDDAKSSPNHTDDRKRVSIKFDDWIFPLDGVCVYLEKNVAK